MDGFGNDDPRAWAGGDDARRGGTRNVDSPAPANTASACSCTAEELDERQLFDVLFELLPDAVIVADENGRIVASNHRAGAMFGYACGELRGHFIEILVPPTQAGQHALDRTRFFSETRSRPMGASRPTLRARRKDDSVFPVDIALSPVPLDGRTYTIAVARDMTERVAMAEQIRRIQKLEAIGQLSSGIAHDFNNVLALVLSSADLLRQRAGMSAEAHAAIKRIDSACKLGMSLTRRLMSLARQQQQDPEAVDIRKRMADVVEVLRRTLSDRIVVSECYTGDVWPCWVDAAQLENAILNLAFNARDAMPLGGRLVFRLANRRIDDLEAANGLRISPGDYVSIELEDTGEGITPEIARRAFEPFFTTKPTEKGTGLGLAMVYSFAVQSKGAVRLEALSGGGCKAEILLPRYVASAHTGKDALSAQRSKSDTVLVVDDDSTLLLAVAEMLTASGLYPVKADSISDAMDKLAARDDISIILTDLLLANGESGYDLAQQALQYSPELHIVCMSGFSDEFVVPQNLTGRIHMLRKPFDRRELLSVFPARALST